MTGPAQRRSASAASPPRRRRRLRGPPALLFPALHVGVAARRAAHCCGTKRRQFLRRVVAGQGLGQGLEEAAGPGLGFLGPTVAPALPRRDAAADWPALAAADEPLACIHHPPSMPPFTIRLSSTSSPRALSTWPTLLRSCVAGWKRDGEWTPAARRRARQGHLQEEDGHDVGKRVRRQRRPPHELWPFSAANGTTSLGRARESDEVFSGLLASASSLRASTASRATG